MWKKIFSRATKAILPAMIGSTIEDGTDTHPTVAIPRVRVWAKVNADT